MEIPPVQFTGEFVLALAVLLSALARSVTFRCISHDSPLSTSGLPRLQNYAFLSIMCYALLLALLQLTVLGFPSDEVSDPWIACVRPILAIAWVHSYSTARSSEPGRVYFSTQFAFFLVLNAILDIAQIVNRSWKLACQDECPPIVLGGATTLDLILSSVDLGLVSMLAFVSLPWSSVSYQSVPTSPDGSSAFSDMGQKLGTLLPYLWPSEFLLRFNIMLCFVFLILGRVVNVLVPLQYKRVVDAITFEPGQDRLFLVTPVLWYVLLRFLQGGNGLIQTIQSYFWISVEQRTTKNVSLSLFSHLHALSLQWHLKRKTGEVLRVMDRGTQAITSLLSYIFFNIAPVIFDIVIAVAYFVAAFDVYFGLTVLLTMIAYVACTVGVTEWRTKFRREMIELDNKTNAKAIDSLLNFETVKYYGNEEYEANGYAKFITLYQKADFLSQMSLRLLNFSQNTVINVGLLAGSIMCAWRVYTGKLTVADFVLFVAYLQQLYTPLNFFGTYYRVINQNFIDMEKMISLLNEEQGVKDLPTAKQLVLTEGRIQFDNVQFSYNQEGTSQKKTIKNLSFSVEPGKTVAFCGPSGGGKSTILRLLFRFYDISEGTIRIDGQDISGVTQKSLRSVIGVVPQDTVLFNDTIANNLRYGRTNATAGEVAQASRLARIHEKIMEFEDKYDTVVGERGLRLSGGEKQRVAIARTLLKNPPIILFDEATSALDNATEAEIQNEMKKVAANRTTIIVAHRLTTIKDADKIIVLKDGQIVEQGKHEDLVQMRDGLYKEMWYKQAKDTSE